MQKWEYKIVVRWWLPSKTNLISASEFYWHNYVDDNLVADEILQILKDFGQQGWELVSVVAETIDVAPDDSNTNFEKWIFKRPIEA